MNSGPALNCRGGCCYIIPNEPATLLCLILPSIASSEVATSCGYKLTMSAPAAGCETAVTKPGGRVGVIVRAIDRGCWVNLPLDPGLKAKVEIPGMIGGGMSPQGCADARLYTLFHAIGLTGLRGFPQLVAVRPGSLRLPRYQQQILKALNLAETETWHATVAQAESDGTSSSPSPFIVRREAGLPEEERQTVITFQPGKAHPIPGTRDARRS
jgi:hypothetical protein